MSGTCDTSAPTRGEREVDAMAEPIGRMTDQILDLRAQLAAANGQFEKAQHDAYGYKDLYDDWLNWANRVTEKSPQSGNLTLSAHFQCEIEAQLAAARQDADVVVRWRERGCVLVPVANEMLRTEWTDRPVYVTLFANDDGTYSMQCKEAENITTAERAVIEAAMGRHTARFVNMRALDHALDVLDIACAQLTALREGTT